MDSFSMASHLATRPARADRFAIHANSHRLIARMLAVQLTVFGTAQLVFGLLNAVRGGGLGGLGWGPIIPVGMLFVARQIVRGTPPLFATRSGLQFGSGQSARLVPWAQVRQVTQLPYYYLTTSTWSRMYQVELSSGAPLRFVGRKDALERIAKLRKEETR